MPLPEDQLIKARLEKLTRIQSRGCDPYPHKYNRTHSSQAAVKYFENLEKTQENKQSIVTGFVSVAGRVMAFRAMGNATFVDLMDGEGRLQVLFKRDQLMDGGYETIKDMDIGDWIGVEGPLFRTRSGQVTVQAKQWTMLSKSLRPLPEKWHGLQEVETRYRQRYLDLISNDEARHIALLRSRIITALRYFMDARGFIEVETPVLVPVAAGAMAHPFITHHNTLDRDLYLRIATELYLKRLIVGGLEKVYEVGKVFRNEGVDFYHNPEFTMLESYEAFADYNDVMRMVEEMVSGLATQVLGTAKVEYGGHTIDLTPPWKRLDLREQVIAHSGIDFLEYNDLEALASAMAKAGLDVAHQVSLAGLLNKLVSETVEPHLVEPTFLLDYPVVMSPLAKKKRDNPRLVERFEGFVAGMEVCNAFTELNDPVDQRSRFEEQEELHARFQNEEMDRLDEDFLVAVEHGMPPTGGLGVGVDRLIMLFAGQKTIREVVLFPQLRTR